MHKTNHACCWCTDLRTGLTETRDMELCPNYECKIKKKADSVKEKVWDGLIGSRHQKQ